MSDVKIADITERHTLQFTVSQYNAKNHIGKFEWAFVCWKKKNEWTFSIEAHPKYRNSESLCICTCGFINSTIASILYVPLYASTVETFTVDQSSKLGTCCIFNSSGSLCGIARDLSYAFALFHDHVHF